MEPASHGHRRDTQNCPYYPGVRIKRGVAIQVTDTYFVITVTEAHDLYATKIINIYNRYSLWNYHYITLGQTEKATRLNRHVLKRK